MDNDMANGRVTTKEFYEKMVETERRVLKAIDELDCKIDANKETLAKFEERTQSHERRLDSHSSKIEILQDSDRKWGAFNALLVAIGATIATLLGINN